MNRIFPWLVVTLAMFLVSAGSAEDNGQAAAVHFSDGAYPERALAETAGDSGVTASSIVGDDGRTAVADSTAFPFRAVAYLERYDAAGFRGRCTGMFISHDTILTAAHCVYTEAAGWVTDIVVVPGKNGDLEPFGAEWAHGWLVPPAWVATGSQDHDWAIIALSPGSSLAPGWFDLAPLADGSLLGPLQPTIVGYPGDKPAGTMWLAQAPALLSASDTHVFHDIDTAAGVSGSPIFASSPASEYAPGAIGLHTTGYGSHNSGIRLGPPLIDALVSACGQLGCSFNPGAEEAALPAFTTSNVVAGLSNN